MKLLHSVPVSNSSMTFYLPKGQFGSFFIEYVPTAAAGVTLTRSQYGNVILNWNGQDVVNVDAEIINLLDNVYGGVSQFTPVVADVSRMSLFLTAGLWFDSSNVYDIGENDRVYIKLDFSELADIAKVASGLINVYGKEKTGVMNYLHNIIARPIVASGASTLADSFPLNNISQVYLKNPTALLTNVQITKDGNTVVDASPNALISYSDFIHQLETTNTTLAIDFVESRDIREAVGNTVSYRFTFSGAGTQNMYFSYVDFTPGKAIESQARAETKLAPILNQTYRNTGVLTSSLTDAQKKTIDQASKVGSVGGRY